MHAMKPCGYCNFPDIYSSWQSAGQCRNRWSLKLQGGDRKPFCICTLLFPTRMMIMNSIMSFASFPGISY
ncbi:unnamed protein product [Musa banksii]